MKLNNMSSIFKKNENNLSTQTENEKNIDEDMMNDDFNEEENNNPNDIGNKVDSDDVPSLDTQRSSNQSMFVTEETHNNMEDKMKMYGFGGSNSSDIEKMNMLGFSGQGSSGDTNNKMDMLGFNMQGSSGDVNEKLNMVGFGSMQNTSNKLDMLGFNNMQNANGSINKKLDMFGLGSNKKIEVFGLGTNKNKKLDMFGNQLNVQNKLNQFGMNMKGGMQLKGKKKMKKNNMGKKLEQFGIGNNKQMKNLFQMPNSSLNITKNMSSYMPTLKFNAFNVEAKARNVMVKHPEQIARKRIDQQKYLSMFGDFDKDKLANILDCNPRNINEQAFWHNVKGFFGKKQDETPSIPTDYISKPVYAKDQMIETGPGFTKFKTRAFTTTIDNKEISVPVTKKKEKRKNNLPNEVSVEYDIPTADVSVVPPVSEKKTSWLKRLIKGKEKPAEPTKIITPKERKELAEAQIKEVAVLSQIEKLKKSLREKPKPFRDKYGEEIDTFREGTRAALPIGGPLAEEQAKISFFMGGVQPSALGVKVMESIGAPRAHGVGILEGLGIGMALPDTKTFAEKVRETMAAPKKVKARPTLGMEPESVEEVVIPEPVEEVEPVAEVEEIIPPKVVTPVAQYRPIVVAPRPVAPAVPGYPPVAPEPTRKIYSPESRKDVTYRRGPYKKTRLRQMKN